MKLKINGSMEERIKRHKQQLSTSKGEHQGDNKYNLGRQADSWGGTWISMQHGLDPAPASSN